MDIGCPRRFLLVRFHIGDLPLQQMVEIREHLAGCERCREILAGMECRRRDFLERHPVGEAVPEIMAKAERRTGGRLHRWWRRLQDWLAGGRI